ncbi:MAG: GDP-mannose 4,6-dehydratase [Cellulosilyticaceae bacterium]
MRALITGIDGFVGYHLYKLLISQGVEVHGTTILKNYTNEEVSLYTMDLLNKDEVTKIIQKVQPDYVYHLAGQSAVGLSWQAPVLTMNVNINGTINLLDAIRKESKLCRVLIIGSSDQYGPVTPQMCPIKEAQALNPVSPYGISKCTQEQMAQLYVKAYGMDIVMVRAFNHIGPMQGINFVISDFASKIVAIEKGSEPIIKVGNLDAYRDFTDVRDIVRGYSMLMQKGHKGEVYNIGSGKSIQIQDVLEILLSLAKLAINVQVDVDKLRPLDVPKVVCDNSKIRNHTGWAIENNINQTLQDTLDYWRSM